MSFILIRGVATEMSNEKHTNCEEFSGLERGLEKRHGSLEATERDQVTIFDCSKRQEVLKEAKKKEMDIKAEVRSI